MPANVTSLPRASGRREWLLRLSLLVLSFLVLTYYALNHGSYSLLDRQQMAVFVWVGIGVAAICGVLPAVKPPRVLLIPLVAVLAFAAWTLLSLTWTESAERTFAEFARIVGYVGVLILVWIGIGRSTWRLVAAGLLTAGVLVCFLTMLSRFWPAMFPSDTVAENLKTTRINYPFGYWNAVGCWSAMTITLCLAYAGHARSAVVRGLALAAVPMCSVGLYLALSRAGIGGAILGSIVVIAMAEWRWLTFIQTALAALGSLIVAFVVHGHTEIVKGTGSEGAWSIAAVLLLVSGVLGLIAWSGGRAGLGERMRMGTERGRPLGVATAITAAIAFVAVLFAFGGRAYDQFTGKDVVVIANTPDARLAQLNGNRHNLWDSGWDAFTANPVVGIGPGTFEFWWSRSGANAEFVRDVHNIFLEALAETGLVGFALLLVFLFGLIWAAWRARAGLSGVRDGSRGIQAGLVAVFVVFVAQAALDWMWESTAIAVFALAAIGVAGASSSPRRNAGSSASKSVGILLAALLAVIIMLPGLSNQRQIDKSQAAFRAKDYKQSLTAADQAIKAESWSATAYGQRALALMAMGDLKQAQTAIDLAEAKEPTNWRWPLISLQIAIQEGDAERAVAARRRVIELRRYSRVLGQMSPAIR
ncbi:MAG: O-antigen ligase family protein [Thermoleophilaceae bacterium]|nr:O-antigen ligase family protein [Thermoleophilaceae bacterium]